MNEQKSVKNDDINLQTNTLRDLPVTDEQADRATGGVEYRGKLIVGIDNVIVR